MLKTLSNSKFRTESSSYKVIFCFGAQRTFRGTSHKHKVRHMCGFIVDFKYYEKYF